MLLNNYYKLRNTSFLTPPTGGVLVSDLPQIKLSNGTLRTLEFAECSGMDRLFKPVYYANNVYTSLPSTSAVISDNKYIVFGDGDAIVTLDDYSISGNVIPNLKCTSVAVFRIDDGARVTYTFQNNGATPAIIKEVCIFDNFAATSTARKCALWREVFDEPLTVGAGESFIYNFEYTQE